MILILFSFVFVIYIPYFYLYKVILYPTSSISVMQSIVVWTVKLQQVNGGVLETIIGCVCISKVTKMYKIPEFFLNKMTKSHPDLTQFVQNDYKIVQTASSPFLKLLKTFLKLLKHCKKKINKKLLRVKIH